MKSPDSDLHTYLFRLVFDVSDCVTDSSDFFSLVIGNCDTEFFLKFHDKLYSVKAVSTEVFGEFCSFGYLVFINTKFVYDYSFNA